MTPQQRKECSTFLIKQEEAYKVMREAISKREKTKIRLNTIDYKRGIPMVASSADISSEIYGNTATKAIQQQINENKAQEYRRKLLAFKTSSISAQGNILVPDTVDAKVRILPLIQSKSRVNNYNEQYGDTHYRIFVERRFNRGLERKPPNPERAQLLRDHELLGRQYNIITHTQVTR